MENEKPENKVERRVTPEHKMAMARWMPITTDPIDKYTPEFLKENLPPGKWPVILIRKPGSLELLKSMERIAEAEEAVASEVQKTDNSISGTDGAQSEERVPQRRTHRMEVEMGKSAIEVWREQVTGFSNVTALDKTELKFETENGKITDACLTRVPWNLIIDVFFRYDSLFGLTELEKEGLG